MSNEEIWRKKEYLSLDKLKVYQLARELSKIVWRIYEALE